MVPINKKYIGIDLGTSAVKLLLVDGRGQILGEVTKEYPLSFPQPGWSEQSPEDWWKAVQHGILQLTEHTDKSEIRGIGVGGQMHGLVALDAQDRVIRPAILWNDGRTGERPSCCGCAKTSRKTSRASRRSCCRRTTSTTA